MNVSSQLERSLPQEAQIEPKRRKVRKGTQSCWECKRRKIRCQFVAKTDLICDGCKRRKTSCISQEFPDDSVKAEGESQLGDRLARMEAVVDRLFGKFGNEKLDHGRNSPTLNAEHLRDEARCSSPDTQGSSTGEAIPIVFDSRNAGWHSSLSRMLTKAWPSPRDLETILDLPSEISGLFHGTMWMPFSMASHQKTPSPREVLQLPPTGSHPLLIARKLLILAIYLQGLSSACMQNLDNSGVDYRAVMSSAAETAHGCVTTNDNLLGSIEGIECVLIESMYQNNAGKLRRAWHSCRRAMLIAQMMGLHQSTRLQSLKFLETETRTRVHPEYMWFRLIQMDRYLSLMLGLPQGTVNNSFADDEVLECCSPTERMQRMDCAIGGYILQRNEAGLYDTTTTHTIDQLLQKSAASLPPRWWLMPDLDSGTGEEMEILEKIIRLMDQLTHYHLIAQLHLPYLVRSHEDHKYDYSKITAIDASREVLIRFTSLRGAHSFTSFCRGISFLAFIACTIVCIIHIDVKRHRQDCTHSGGVMLGLLANQHQRDRGMMELTLDSMQRIACETKDLIASKTAVILSHLLSMEADAALCEEYLTNPATKETEGGLGCVGKVSDCGQILQVFIPYLGTIKFERGSNSGPVSVGLPPFAEKSSVPPVPETCSPASLYSMDSSFVSQLHSGQEPQLQDASDPTSRGQLNGLPINQNWQVPSPTFQQSHLRHFMSATDHSGVLDDSLPPETVLPDSTQAATLNGWNLHNDDRNCCEFIIQDS